VLLELRLSFPSVAEVWNGYLPETAKLSLYAGSEAERIRWEDLNPYEFCKNMVDSTVDPLGLTGCGTNCNDSGCALGGGHSTMTGNCRRIRGV
jgi:hypothetical protein